VSNKKKRDTVGKILIRELNISEGAYSRPEKKNTKSLSRLTERRRDDMVLEKTEGRDKFRKKRGWSDEGKRGENLLN